MASSGKQPRNGAAADAGEIVRAAVTVVAELTGRRPETVLGLQREEEGWTVIVELVELSRIPSSTDVLGAYVVKLDKNGELLGYERQRRYQRGETNGAEG